MSGSSRTLEFPSKPRVFILSDISNEPDDAESLVRYLLYSNQFRTEGLVAVTSTWMKTKVCPQDMEKIIRAYANAVESLNAHVHPEHPYPPADLFLSVLRTGHPVYGMDAVGGALSRGAELLLERLDSSDEPLWVLCWGGTNVLAEVLFETEKRSHTESVKLRQRLRVYAISDQDDTGMWIRTKFPDIFYIVSVHAWNQYGQAAWTGISGDMFYGFDQGGPDFTKMTKEWIKEHIQIGPLGSAYPDYMFIPEGDTPTFLGLIQNGLNMLEHPEYGSWGGRYALTDPSEKGSKSKIHNDAVDHAVGLDGRTYKSNHVTIWRWRDAFQDDFRARIQWTLSSNFKSANHHPVIVLNGVSGLEPLHVEAEAGSTIEFDASETYDPDKKDVLTFSWTHYREPSATQWWVTAEVAQLGIEPRDVDSRRVRVTLPPPEKCAVDLMSRNPLARGQLLHLILEVKDNGIPPLRSYRRILVQVTNHDLRGGGKAIEAVGDLAQSDI